MATEIKTMDGAIALVLGADGDSEPTAQLTVFTDDSYPSGIFALGGMDKILEVDLPTLVEFLSKIRPKIKPNCRCTKTHN